MHHYRIRQIVRAMFALLLMVVMTSSLLPAAPALAQSPSVRYLIIAKADTPHPPKQTLHERQHG